MTKNCLMNKLQTGSITINKTLPSLGGEKTIEFAINGIEIEVK